MEQLSICVDAPELSIHALQVMEEFWKSRQNNKDIMALDKVHVWVGTHVALGGIPNI